MSLPLAQALTVLRDGGMVVVSDRADRENEGDLVMAASSMTPQKMAFYLRHGSGIVCVPMPDERADELDLPLMVERNGDRHGTAFTVTVDECTVGTGISASDRARTVTALADPGAMASDFNRPGHVFPLRARPGGVLQRAGHTEASVDLLALAGHASSVAVITELVDDEGVPLGGPRVVDFARRHALPFVEMDSIASARLEEPAALAGVGYPLNLALR